MTLNVKDAAGTTVPLKSTTDTGEEVPNHIVDTGSGAGATIGAVADAAVVTDTTGTISGKLRGIVSLIKDLKALFPTSVGATIPGGSLSVTLPSNSQVTGNLTGAGQSDSAIVGQGQTTLVFRLTGTWVASVVVEVSQDGSTTWDAVPIIFSGGTISLATTSTGLFIVSITGYQQVRIRCSAYTSGTIVVNGYTSQGAFSHYIQWLYDIDVNTLAISSGVGTALDTSSPSGGTGSLNAKLRGAVALLAAAIDITNGFIKARPAACTTVTTGEKQGSATASQFATVTSVWVKVKAQYDNAGRVYIGNSSVTKPDGTTDTTSGLMLQAGEETGWLPIDNLNRLYLICDNAGDDVTYFVLA